MTTDWETFAKRLIAANQLGLRITQADGHRWIESDLNSEYVMSHGLDNVRSKQYESYDSALDHIDEVLSKNGHDSLLKVFDTNINYYDNLGVVFGKGTQ